MLSRSLKLFLVSVLVGTFCIACGNSEKKVVEQEHQTAEGSKKLSRYGEVKKNLGNRSFGFGSTAQAQELLKLIDENLNKVEYQIIYQTNGETVLVSCNFDKDVIIRIHQRNDGHGTQEMWKGYIIERLKNAAKGGTLNDTPVGKKLGTFQSF